MYEPRFDDHARDTKRETIELQRFVQRVPRAKAEHLTATELLCIAYVRRVFEQPGLFALPAELFDFATLASSAPESNGPRGGMKPRDVLQGVSLAASSWGSRVCTRGQLVRTIRTYEFLRSGLYEPATISTERCMTQVNPAGARRSAPRQSNGVRAAREHHGVQR